jgi:PadR family transcriptional regulator, regulatory protein PadR
MLLKNPSLWSYPMISLESLSPTEELILLRMPREPWPDPEEFYGLQIADSINTTAKGRLEVTPGTLYPTLRRLEKKGYLSTRWGSETFPEYEGSRRKYYRITDSGRRAIQWLHQLREDLAADSSSNSLPNAQPQGAMT